MSLYDELSLKQRRSIRIDIASIISVKGLCAPKTVQEMRDNLYKPTIKVGRRELYFSETGQAALNRITDFVYGTKKYYGLLNYADMKGCVLDEIERWVNDRLIPDDAEFIDALDLELSKKVDNYVFVCRIDGISFKDLDGIKIGEYEIRTYDPVLLDGISNTELIDGNIKEKEYKESMVIIGSETASQSLAMEKFCHNADLYLSVLRLYSCALYRMAIRRIKIRLIDNCAKAYGPASALSWRSSEKSLIFHRYYKDACDFKIDAEQLNHMRSQCFYEVLSGLVRKEGKNELESAIVKSIFWYGEAQNDHSRASSWIKLWSSMECLFTTGDEEITERNAKGIASLLLFGGYRIDRFGTYRDLKQKIRKYYDLRSRVVHRAEYTHIDTTSLDEFSYIAAWVIITATTLLTLNYSRRSQIQEQASRLDDLEKKTAMKEFERARG